MTAPVLKDASDVQMALGPEAVLAMRKRAVPVEIPSTTYPPDLARILDSIREFLLRYMIFSSDAHADVISLWIAHTWAIDAFDFTPYLHIHSPVKRCGKSTLLDCLALLVRSAWQVVLPSVAVVFRKIEANCPALLLDEVDTIFKNGKNETYEALRAILNAGFQRSAKVPRCVGPTQKLENFSVFCAKAIAGIGKLPDTVADRSIPILLARRSPSQNVHKFRARDVQPLAEEIAQSLAKWGEHSATLATLRVARPDVPGELGDRQADICEPLLAIADLAGGGWPEIVRRALVELYSGAGAQDDNISVKLLASFREIFEERKVDSISTRDALEALIARDDDSPWASFWEKDMASQNTRGAGAKLARMLKPFGVLTHSIRLDDGSTPKGYKRDSFADAWARYLP